MPGRRARPGSGTEGLAMRPCPPVRGDILGKFHRASAATRRPKGEVLGVGERVHVDADLRDENDAGGVTT